MPLRHGSDRTAPCWASLPFGIRSYCCPELRQEDFAGQIIEEVRPLGVVHFGAHDLGKLQQHLSVRESLVDCITRFERAGTNLVARLADQNNMLVL